MALSCAIATFGTHAPQSQANGVVAPSAGIRR
jgi:hypothetical protein